MVTGLSLGITSSAHQFVAGGFNISTDGTYAEIDTAQYKFGGSSFYSNNNGWIRADTPNNEMNFGTGDFTVELWYRIPNTTGDYKLCGSQGQTGGFDLRLINGVYHLGRINDAWDQTATSGATINTWHHVAVSRSGSTCRIYHNGSQVASGTNTSNYHFGTTNIGPYFGDESVYDFYATDFHLDEMRISSIPRYTSGFTAPTAPFINDSDTLLLIHADGTDGSTNFYDDVGTGIGRSRQVITAINDAQIDTAQSKFGGASALFDGTGDYLSISGNSNLDLSGDFTIEFYARHGVATGNQKYIDLRPDDVSGLTDYLLIDTNNNFRLFIDGSDRLGGGAGAPSVDTWYHIAVVRQGTSIRYYLDGTEELDYTQASPKDYTLDYDWVIAINGGNLTGDGLNGHLDEIRISNIARYTTGFTPSTTAFSNDANTLLLLHMDGTDGSTTFEDDNG